MKQETRDEFTTLWKCILAQCDFLEEIGSRLQALEQNTVPSREAKQKPREWFSVVLSDGTVIGYLTLRDALDQLIEDELPHTSIVRVREVLDE